MLLLSDKEQGKGTHSHHFHSYFLEVLVSEVKQKKITTTKLAEDLNRCYLKEDTQKAKGHMKRPSSRALLLACWEAASCSSSLSSTSTTSLTGA